MKSRFSNNFIVPDLAIEPRLGGYARGREGHELILRAALNLLVEHGSRAMSMRRVAAACDMKLGNLTYYFATKEDLVRELLDAIISSYEIEFDAIVHEGGISPENRLTHAFGPLPAGFTSASLPILFNFTMTAKGPE